MVTDDMTEVKRQIANGPLARSGILDVKSVELAACGAKLLSLTLYFQFLQMG